MKREIAIKKSEDAHILPIGTFFSREEIDRMISPMADVLQRECDQREGLIEMAWAIIRDAGEGNWNKEHPDWRKAAARFRDEYHKFLNEKSI